LRGPQAHTKGKYQEGLRPWGPETIFLVIDSGAIPYKFGKDSVFFKEVFQVALKLSDLFLK
jgi:hypothetical protein